MRLFTRYWALTLLPVALSCSAVSSNLRSEALKDVSFEQMVQETQTYQGQTVILGGYILETRNLPTQTLIEVLQAPLGFDDSPQSADKSRGRIVIVCQGYLDPEVYRKDRALTVAGRLVDINKQQAGACGGPACIAVQSLELHLWPTRDAYYGPYPYFYSPYPYYYPYSPYPFFYRRYPRYW